MSIRPLVDWFSPSRAPRPAALMSPAARPLPTPIRPLPTPPSTSPTPPAAPVTALLQVIRYLEKKHGLSLAETGVTRAQLEQWLADPDAGEKLITLLAEASPDDPPSGG